MTLVPDPPPGRISPFYINPREDFDVTLTLTIAGQAFPTGDYASFWAEFKADPKATTTGDFAFTATSPSVGEIQLTATKTLTEALQTNDITRGVVDIWGKTGEGKNKKIAWAVAQVTETSTDTFA